MERELVEFLLRWLHFLAGITWIGMLYYFNFVQTPFFKNAEAAVRSGMIRGIVPAALWWFRWGAMFTFLTGWSIIMMKAHSVPPESTVNWWTTAYATLILTGGIMGTLMWFNVWFIIWPAQKIVIASAEQVAAGGEAIAAAASRGAHAGMASRTNTLFSIPMLFFMGAASHLTNLGQGADAMNPQTMTYWLIAGAIIAIVEITGALAGAGKGFQKHLTSVNGVISAGFVLTIVLYLVAKYVL